MDLKTVERLSEGFGIWFYSIPIFIFIIINADKIKEIILLFERGYENRLKTIDDYLSKDETDSSIRSSFIEMRDRMSFQRVYGVEGSKAFRYAYLNLLYEVEEEIPARSLAVASRYMEEVEGQITVKIPRGSLVGYRLNQFMVFFYIGLSIIISISSAIGINKLPVIMPVIFLCIGIFATLELSPVYTAKKLKEILQRNTL